MRKRIIAIIILTLALLGFTSACFAQCPVMGDNTKPKFQHLDSLKNRSDSGSVDTSVTLTKMIAPGNDANRFKASQFVEITGYILLVKWGGAETCNCHSKDKNDEDYHIELVADLTHHCMPVICEVNRYKRCITWSALKALVGKKVRIQGWIFYDQEHWQNASNTNPAGTNLWRETDVEIHPVISIIPAE